MSRNIKQGFLILFLICSSNWTTADEILVPKERTAIFSKENARLLVKRVSFRPPGGITAFWAPSEGDLSGFEGQLDSYLADVESKNRSRPVMARNWSNYRCQVAGVVINGHKSLFLSYCYFQEVSAEAQAFYERAARDFYRRKGIEYVPHKMDWTKDPYAVSDGGRLFFRVIYDLRQKAFIWYDHNYEVP